jgi:uncharacterized protein (UPF0548 family)
LSYAPVGISAGPHAGFAFDQASGVIGHGEADFVRARDALARWAHFKLGWLDVFPERPELAPGTVVAVVVRHLGFWSINGCRLLPGAGSPAGLRSFAYAYGTLANHAECGEETFEVTQSPATGEVTYVIRASSRPRAWQARLGSPVTRALQARFRRDSIRALARAVRDRPR